MLAQFCAVAVLAAPLSLPAATNDEAIRGLNLTRFVEPTFPAMMRHQGIPEGVVLLAVGRDAAGEPQDILVLGASHLGFVPAALEAVRQWRFAPAAAGERTSAKTVRVGFRLEGVVVMTAFTGEQLQYTPGDPAAPVSVPRVNTAPTARPRNQPMPQYPAALRRQGLEGSAAVSFYVDQEGRVRLPEVVNATAPEFAQAALAAVAQWRYEPKQIGGRRVVACDRWEFRFAAAN